MEKTVVPSVQDELRQAVAVDSQVWTYLHQALSDGFDPWKDPSVALAEQKVAVVRTLFYSPGSLVTLPTVDAEVGRIRDRTRLQDHRLVQVALLGLPLTVENPGEVDRLQNVFRQYHAGANDCRILAEAQSLGIRALLSFDLDFRNHLCQHTSIDLLTPLEFWEQLGIPRGAPTVRSPDPTNPLGREVWWRW